jgi:hyperosmotically inducible protein
MKPLTPLIRWTLLALLALPLALAACSKQVDDDELAAGKSLDGAIAEGEQASADTAITAKVNTALAADEKLHTLAISVATHNGQVTLSGTTPDTQLRDRAVTLASGIDGVKLVNNQLVVGRTS